MTENPATNPTQAHQADHQADPLSLLDLAIEATTMDQADHQERAQEAREARRSAILIDQAIEAHAVTIRVDQEITALRRIASNVELHGWREVSEEITVAVVKSRVVTIDKCAVCGSASCPHDERIIEKQIVDETTTETQTVTRLERKY